MPPAAVRSRPETAHPSRSLARALLGLGLILACLGTASGASAQGEPPIKSAQDAACRNEARARVFSTPDPQGLGLRAVGRQIYMACMQRASAAARRPVTHKSARRPRRTR
ncbi:hypothetical protein [Methylobacterium soli]|uniref:hypothetical protein n=1 Tax=Methylobacterium soli TaxID=553447 RepID=UPI001EE3723C|nr:hypothetical protein [Methylobacterium soli]GJE41895.1 hypothetical protein AEGHOMDF_1065 [Methylobacterium soli]